MSPYEIDTVKIEKEKAMQRYRQFHKIANIVRTLEICFAVMVFLWTISRSSVYLPPVVNFFTINLRRLYAIIFSPHFVFLVGNIIIVTLVVNFGRNTNEQSSSDDDTVTGKITSADVDTDEEDYFMINAFATQRMKNAESPKVEDICEEKAVVSEEVSIVPSESKVSEITVGEVKPEVPKNYRRSKSEQYKAEGVVVESEKKKKKQLQRSETQPSRKSRDSESESDEDLSSEEFRSRVEAFIERQQRFLREESMSRSIFVRISDSEE